MNNPKHKPRPITSFIEDEFEFGLPIKSAFSQETVPLEADNPPEKERFAIRAVRVAMMIIAFFITIALFILISEFISHRQIQRLSPAYAACLSSPVLH